MQTHFISDLHFCHRSIVKFAGKYRTGDTPEANAEHIAEQWRERVRPHDLVYVLGDAAFGKEGLALLATLPGRKHLVAGNHDEERFFPETLLEVFEAISGLVKYKEFWLSHAPIHPAELRGKRNIHGHVHQRSIKRWWGGIDPRYINVCCEATGERPVSLDEIRSGQYDRSIRRC